MTRGQKIGLIILFVLASAGAFYAWKNYHRAFPEIQIPINFKREDALQRADSALTAWGFRASEFRRAAIMDIDENAIIFADKEFSRDTLIKIFENPGIPLWQWKVRYFKPLQKEEFTVGIRPDNGKIAYFEHILPETLSGADLEEPQARKIADSCLVAMGYDTALFELKQSSTEKYPHRRDWNFVYERKIWSLGNAKNWIEITVSGDRISKFNNYLHIPDEWFRNYQKIRSENALYQQIDQLIAIIFGFFMLGYLFLMYRKSGLNWKFGTILGLIAFGGTTAMGITSLPLAIFYYPTTSSFARFLFDQIISAVLNGALVGMLSIVAGVSGERIYREFLPDNSYLPELMLSPSGWRTREFKISILVGYLFAIVHIGFVTFYYVVGRKIGIWAPPDTNYSNLSSTFAPWLYALGIGLSASIFEDLTFRLFGVSFFSKFLKSRVIGIIIPAFIWGFLHSNYPQEPGWARGIEVGIIGIAAGIIMLRYSIVACLTWHFLVDSGLTALIIFRQGTILDIILASIVLIVPIILILLGHIFGEKREISKNIEKLPAAQPATPESAPQIPLTYKPLPRKTKTLIGIISLVSLIIIVISPNYPYQMTAINRKQSIEKAVDILKNENIDAKKYRIVSVFSNDAGDRELLYTYQQCGWQCVNQFFGEDKWKSFYHWSVRFFIPGKKEEYRVHITPGGEPEAIYHTLAENDSGASISQDSALVLAQNLLRKYGKSYVLRWELISKKSEKRPRRTDHFFTWQSPDSIGQAHRRVGVAVLGNQASFSAVYLKRPEEWDRSRSKQTVISGLIFLLYTAVNAIIIVLVIIQFVIGAIKRNTGIKLGIAAALAYILITSAAYANTIPTIFSSYNTAIPTDRFLITKILFILTTIAVGAIGAFFAVSAFGSTQFRRKLAIVIPISDKILVSGSAFLIIYGAKSLLRLLEFEFNLPLSRVPIIFPYGYDTFIPALTIFPHIADTILFSLPTAFVIYELASKKIKSTEAKFAIVMLLAVILGINGKTLPEMFWSSAENIIYVLVLWFVITKILRDNVIFYIATFVLLEGFSAVKHILLPAGNEFFIYNGVIGGIIVVILWLLVCAVFSPGTSRIAHRIDSKDID